MTDLSSDKQNIYQDIAVQDRIAQLEAELENKTGLAAPHGVDSTNCPTFYDCCHCTVETLVFQIKRADKLQTDNDRLAEEAEGLRDDLCYIASTWTGPPSDYAYDAAKAVKAVKEKDEPKTKES